MEWAEALRQAGINLLAIDFDLTLVNTHTCGAWQRNANELARHVRPSLKRLIGAAIKSGINVAVVTFSPQVSR